MLKFILKRVGFGITTMFVIITMTFFLIHAVPGDPMAAGAKNLPESAKAAFKAKYGLDKPVVVQYGMYLKNLITKGELGDSMIYMGRSTNTIIAESAPISADIGIRALIIEIGVGLILGIIAAFNRGKRKDQIIMFLVIVLICIPSFVFCALLQYVFAVKLRLVPVMGWGNPKQYVLPVIAMCLSGIAMYTKFMRNSTLNVIGQDYILTARAKGVGKFRLVKNHVLRNALIPIVTLIGPSILFIFAGAFIIESIFAIPGLGRYFVSAVNDSDYSIIMGLTIFLSGLYIASLILVDILYGIVDPRIRLTKGNGAK
jgi:oligopeptide transport system permease protein